MKTVDFIIENDLIDLIPHVHKFAIETDTPLSVHLNEVSKSLLDDNYLTIIGKSEDQIIAYLCGYRFSKNEFIMSQMYSIDPEITKVIGHFLDDHLLSVGITRIITLFKHHPRTAERHGFRIERYMMVKDIGKEEEK